MPLSLVDAATQNNAITGILQSYADITMPKTKKPSNTDPVAWKLFLAQRMSAFAEGFKKSATKDAIAAGVLFDHAKEPRNAGVDEDIYSGDVVRVNLKTKNGSVSLDSKKLGILLVADGKVTQSQWDAYVAQCSKTNAAPHTFIASLKT